MFSRAGTTYCYEDADFRKKLYSPLKTTGFVPEKDSEIYVTGLPSHASLHDLLVFFEPVGELFQIKLMTKKDGIQNRGFAYVTYMNKQLAQNALHILANKRFMNSKTLSMHLSIDNCRLFLGGIPIEKSKTAIWQELMNAYGVKNIVDVITYRNYANPTHNRGFVFLEFRTHEEASYFRAKYWDKLYLFGRQVLVDWAIPNNFQFNDTKAMAEYEVPIGGSGCVCDNAPFYSEMEASFEGTPLTLITHAGPHWHILSKIICGVKTNLRIPELVGRERGRKAGVLERKLNEHHLPRSITGAGE